MSNGKEEVKHFLETEIKISKERTKLLNPIYDGQYVGVLKANKLLDNHIRFCKRILELLK